MEIAAYIVFMLVSYALAVHMAPKPEKPKPAALADFEIPTAEEGRPIPVVFGTVRINGPNVIWYGDLRTVPIKTKGGKK